MAVERTVDVDTAAHEVECLADVALGHERATVTTGRGVGIDHIIAIKLLCHRERRVSP